MRTATRLTILVSAAALYAQQPASVWDGVYTQEQAGRGKSLYAKECASCHGATLDGSGQVPPLAGADFKGNWNGQSADDLFEKMQTSMPADQPGRLSREQNADILAFLLSSNAFPAGQKELPSEAAALQKIRFEAAKSK
jgi:S-disulfanyl-L-cysteine oxidoreductase SoxD